jgi:hypothetical protein
MVLTGFADYDRPDPLLHDQYRGEADHVVWSVPPQAAAALADDARAWADASEPSSQREV